MTGPGTEHRRSGWTALCATTEVGTRHRTFVQTHDTKREPHRDVACGW